MLITASQLFDQLINDEKLLTKEGKITFSLGSVNIQVKQKDVVGNLLQEWVEGWLKLKGVEFQPNPNTQMPPDFFLRPDNHTKELLEVKAFNAAGSPGFDIADFRSYEEELIEKPYMLNVDYLIFGYLMDDEGIVTVKNVWLKKVWEITRAMEGWPLNLQVKANVVHKIRPGVWYRNSQFDMFQSKEHFLSALEQTIWQNPKTREDSAMWKVKFQKAYSEYYKTELAIPRWDDIKDQYKKKTKGKAQVKK